MPKYIVPKYNELIELKHDWSFKLGDQGIWYGVDICEKLFPGQPRHQLENEFVTLPAGTVLTFHKIEFRGFSNDFIIFKIRKTNHPDLKFQKGKNKAIFKVEFKQMKDLEFEVVEDD